MPVITCQRGNVLVLVFLGLLLAGLGAVGIHRMRESADAISCQNNLKQLSLALQSYHDANERLPPLFDLGNGAVPGRGLSSAFGLLMPYIECSPLMFRPEYPPERYHGHSSVSFRIQWKDGETVTQNGGMANNPLSVFRCPIDRTADKLRDVPMTLPDGSVGYYATGSYAANRALPWGGGKFFSEATIKTVLFAERPQVCRTAGDEEMFNLWGLGFDSPHVPAFRADALPDQAFQWVRSGIPCDPRLPGTGHRSGILAAVSDGSVRVFVHGTNPSIFRAACQQP